LWCIITGLRFMSKRPTALVDDLMSAQVFELANPETTADAATRCVLEGLDEALSVRERATLAISGGSAPKILFPKLAASPIRWDRVHLFWVDERSVPPDHAESNYRLANELLVIPSRIPRAQVHRIQAEAGPQEAAQRYEKHIREFFGLPGATQPVFDVIHLGIGPDGHTASLFPGEPLLEDRSGTATAVYVPKMKTWRITLLPGALLAARHTLFFAVGEDKAEVVGHIFGPEYAPRKWPAQLISRHGENVIWFLDQAAARYRPRNTGSE
jgi:6-phosphogluconolactonase